MWNWYVSRNQFNWDWTQWETWILNWEYVDSEPEMGQSQGAD